MHEAHVVGPGPRASVDPPSDAASDLPFGHGFTARQIEHLRFVRWLVRGGRLGDHPAVDRRVASAPRSGHPVKAPLALLALLVALVGAAPARAQGGCELRHGFAELAALVPEVVGACLEDEQHDPASEVTTQRTTAWHGRGGLLVWEKDANRTTFTDGHRTWERTPAGVAVRPNGSPRAAPAPPRPGRSVLADRRLVTYYGHPSTPLMGILGQLGKEELVAALAGRAAEYERVGGKPVQGAVHLIATVAHAAPGADGLYRGRTPGSVIEEYADLAAAHGMLLILDLQPGRSTVADEVAAVVPYLRRPHVHLALDPEFNMAPGQRPGVQLGSMDAREINHAVAVLAETARAHDLPNKVLIVHQFAASMITNKAAIVDHPRVDVVIDMDGFGGRGIKARQYGIYVRDQPVEFAGIKLFLQHDADLLAPADVLALEPTPDVVVYQ